MKDDFFVENSKSGFVFTERVAYHQDLAKHAIMIISTSVFNVNLKCYKSV